MEMQLGWASVQEGLVILASYNNEIWTQNSYTDNLHTDIVTSYTSDKI